MKIINNQFNQSLKSITNKGTLYFFFFLLLFLFNCLLPVDFKAPITESDFTPPVSEVDRKLGYINTNYGKIVLKEGVDATFSIASDATSNTNIVIDGDGNITIPTGLEVGEYPFQVEINGSYDYEGSVKVDLNFIVKPHTGSITSIADINNLNLTTSSTPTTIEFATAEVDGKPYLFAISPKDDKLYMFEVDSAGGLTKITEVANSDDADFRFEGTKGLVTATVGGKTYVVVSGSTGIGDQGLSVFRVDASSGQLVNVDNISDAQENRQASEISIIQEDGGRTYIFTGEKGLKASTFTHFKILSLYEINDDGQLTFLDKIETFSDKNLSLRNFVNVNIDGYPFLFVFEESDSLSVYRVVNNELLLFNTLFASSLFDSGNTHRFVSLTFAKVKEAIYFFLLNTSDGVTKMTTFSPYFQDFTINFNKASEIILEHSSSLFITTKVDDANYLLFSPYNENKLTMFSVADDGTLFDIGNILSNRIDSIIKVEVDERTYLLANGRENNNTISIFELKK